MSGVFENFGLTAREIEEADRAKLRYASKHGLWNGKICGPQVVARKVQRELRKEEAAVKMTRQGIKRRPSQLVANR